MAESHGGELHHPKFRRIADKIFSKAGTRPPPYSGIPTFLTAPYREIVAIDGGLPTSATFRSLLGGTDGSRRHQPPGSRFGPRALRAIERIGPYNHVLDCTPVHDLRAADIGDVPVPQPLRLELSHEDIERRIRQIVAAGVVPLAVGGDHSVTHSILRPSAAIVRSG